jgi:hypothetical protein
MLMHSFFSYPEKICTPAIEKMMRKNMRIATTSLSSLIESSNDTTMILSPSIPEMVFRGLSTQKDLRTPMLTPEPKFINSKYPESTITKSRMFHSSLK